MIYEMLQAGPNNALSASYLARVLKMHRREVTRIIERERREGKPICATCNGRSPGYFLPADRAEMEDYIARLHHREKEIAATRAACKKTLRKKRPPQDSSRQQLDTAGPDLFLTEQDAQPGGSAAGGGNSDGTQTE